MSDPYVLSAEFYDVMAGAQWRNAGPLVASVLREVDPTQGPLLEIGAGTGLSTQVIAEAVPNAEIIAVEPSAGMRIAMMSRLASQPGLAQRVTVEPLPFENVELPERLCAAIVVGVVGYLEPAARAAMWPALAQRLPAGAPVVVDVMPIPMPMPVPTRLIAQARFGNLDYEVYLTGKPADKNSMHWTMNYKVLRRGEAIRTFEAEHIWQVFTIDQVIAEATPAGFAATKLTPMMAVLAKTA